MCNYKENKSKCLKAKQMSQLKPEIKYIAVLANKDVVLKEVQKKSKAWLALTASLLVAKAIAFHTAE